MASLENLQIIVNQVVKKHLLDNLFIEVGVSNRHIHLCQEHVEQLFGRGYQLTPLKPLKQPNEFATQETLTVSTQKGQINKVRILGPVRKKTQVELSVTDCYQLGAKIDVRESGKTENTAGIILQGPAGQITLDSGVIVASRHVHMPQNIADQLGLTNGQLVELKKAGRRAVVYENVLLRVSDNYALEAHLDTDEANAGLISSGDLLKLEII